MCMQIGNIVKICRYFSEKEKKNKHSIVIFHLYQSRL
jgi:hypothetical protein